jgi:hypothetical protein
VEFTVTVALVTFAVQLDVVQTRTSMIGTPGTTDGHRMTIASMYGGGTVGFALTWSESRDSRLVPPTAVTT